MTFNYRKTSGSSVESSKQIITLGHCFNVLCNGVWTRPYNFSSRTFYLNCNLLHHSHPHYNSYNRNFTWTKFAVYKPTEGPKTAWSRRPCYFLSLYPFSLFLSLTVPTLTPSASQRETKFHDVLSGLRTTTLKPHDVVAREGKRVVNTLIQFDCRERGPAKQNLTRSNESHALLAVPKKIFIHLKLINVPLCTYRNFWVGRIIRARLCG